MSFLPTLEADEEEDDMFFVGEEDAVGDDASSASDDSHAEAAFGAFQANKALSQSIQAINGGEKDDDGPHVKIRRNDSFVSFLVRSERAHEHPDEPPSPKEDAKRSVHFRDEHNTEVVLELNPPLSKHEKRTCFLTPDDFDRMQLDVDMTLRRWSYHEEGKLPFDGTKNTLRGLESVCDRQRPKIVFQHTKSVLEEIHRQKVDESELDWEKVRQASRRSSSEDYNRAVLFGEKDAEAAVEAWNEPKAAPAKKDPSPKKSKGLGSFKFWGSKKDKK